MRPPTLPWMVAMSLLIGFTFIHEARAGPTCAQPTTHLNSGSTFTIATPNFPAPYAPAEICAWQLTFAVGQVHRLVLNASFTDVADSLAIYDGADESAPMMLGFVVEDTTPPWDLKNVITLQSTQHEVFVVFVSANQTKSSDPIGFKLVTTEISPPADACGPDSTTLPAFANFSVGGQAVYPPNYVCRHVFKNAVSRDGMYLILRTLQLQAGDSVVIKQNEAVLFAGGQLTSDALGADHFSIFGRDAIELELIFTSQNTQKLMRVPTGAPSTYDLAVAAGLRLEHGILPNMCRNFTSLLATATPQTISDPPPALLAYPDALPVDGRRCQWLIDAGPNKIVQFTFNPELVALFNPLVTIYDGADDRAPCVSTVEWAGCGVYTLQSTGRFILVERAHDSFEQASALLNLNYSSVAPVGECDDSAPTVLTTATGVISTISTPPPNPLDTIPWLGPTPGRQCVFNVEIASAAVIHFIVVASFGKASMIIYDTSGGKPNFFAAYEVGGSPAEWVLYSNKAQVVLVGGQNDLPGLLTVEYTGWNAAPAPICQGTQTVDLSFTGTFSVTANNTHHFGAGVHCFWHITTPSGYLQTFGNWLTLGTSAGLDLQAGDYIRVYAGPNITTPVLLEYSARTQPPPIPLALPGDPISFQSAGTLNYNEILFELYTARGRHNTGLICGYVSCDFAPSVTCRDRPNTFTNVVQEALVLDLNEFSPLLCPFYFSLAPGAPETGFNVSVDLTTGIEGQWMSIFTNSSDVPIFRRDLVLGSGLFTVYIEARSIRVEIYYYNQCPQSNQIVFTVSKAFASVAASLPASAFPTYQRIWVDHTATLYPENYLSAQPGDFSELIFDSESGCQIDISIDLPGTGEAYVAVYDGDERLLRNFTSPELIASFWAARFRVVLNVWRGNVSAVYSGIAYVKYIPYEFHWCSGFKGVAVLDSAKEAWEVLSDDSITRSPDFKPLGPVNLFCAWRIIGPRGYPLLMTVVSRPSLLPPDAHVLVYNGQSAHSPLIANISQANPHYSNVLGGDNVYVEYHGGALPAVDVSGKFAPVPSPCQDSVRRLLAREQTDFENVQFAGFNPPGRVCETLVILPYPTYPRSVLVDGYLGVGYFLSIFADGLLVATYGSADAITRLSYLKPVTLLSGMNLTLRFEAGAGFDAEAVVQGVLITFPSDMPINSGVVAPVLPLPHLRPPRARVLWSSTSVAVTPERMPELAQLHYCNHLCFLVNVTAVFSNLLLVDNVVRGSDCFFTFDAPELRVAHRMSLLATPQYPLLTYPRLPKLEYAVIMCFAYASEGVFSFPALYNIDNIEFEHNFPSTWNTPRLEVINSVKMREFTVVGSVFLPTTHVMLCENVHLANLILRNPIAGVSTALEVWGPNATVGTTTFDAIYAVVVTASPDYRLDNIVVKNSNLLTVCRHPDNPMTSIVGDSRWAFGVDLENVDVVLLPNATLYLEFDGCAIRFDPLIVTARQLDLREMAYSELDIEVKNSTLRDIIMPKLVSAPRISLVNNSQLESVQMCRLRYVPRGGFTVLGSPRLSCADMERYNATHLYADSAFIVSPCDPFINGTLTAPDCPPDDVVVAPGPGDCPDPGALLHGSRDYQGPFTDGTTVGFACDDGFRLLGVLALYCEGGVWDAPTPTCPVFDPTIVSPSIETVAPQLAPLRTNVNISIMGSHWNLPLRHVYGGETEISRRAYSVFALSNSRRLLASTHALDFEVAARSQAGYYVVTIDDGFGLAATDDISLYFTDDCPTPGMYGIGLDCHPCPVGGYCPGGNRIWPLPGYWNSGEGSGFVSACPEPPTRCKGGRASGCDVGYEGPLCAVCSKAFYLRGTECVACPGRDEEITLYVIAGVFYGALAVAFSFLSDDSVDMVVTILRVLQLIRAGTTQTGARLPEQAKRVLYYLSLVTFDFEFIKPACGFVSQLPTFSTLFWGNAVIVGLLVVPTFLLLSVMRAVNKKRRTFFTNRMFRAVTIQITLLYYVVTTRAVQAITCIKIGGKYLLAADPSVECSLSDFLVVGGIGMAVFAVVIPLTFLFFVHRLVTSRRWADPTALARFGFLYQQLRVEVGRRYLYVIVPFLHLLMASVAWGVLKTGLGPYILSISSLSVVLAISIALRPFKRGLDNAIVTVTYGFGLASVLLSFLTLSFLPVSVDTAWTVAGLVALLSLGVGFALFYSDLRRLAALERKVAPAPAPTTEPDEKGAELTTFSGVQELPSPKMSERRPDSDSLGLTDTQPANEGGAAERTKGFKQTSQSSLKQSGSVASLKQSNSVTGLKPSTSVANIKQSSSTSLKREDSQ